MRTVAIMAAILLAGCTGPWLTEGTNQSADRCDAAIVREVTEWQANATHPVVGLGEWLTSTQRAEGWYFTDGHCFTPLGLNVTTGATVEFRVSGTSRNCH